MKIFVFFALIAVASAGITRREAPEVSVKSIFENAEKSLEEVKETFLKAWGFKDDQELQDSFKEKGKALASNVDDFLGKLKVETEKFKDNEYVKDLREKAGKLSSDLKANYPQTYADVEKVSGSFENIIKEAQTLAKSKETENFQKTVENILESAKDALQKVIVDVKENVKQ